MALYEFYGNTVADGLGLALVCLAAYQSDKAADENNPRSIAWKVGLSASSLCLSISVYQSFLLAFAGIGAGLLINGLLFLNVSFTTIYRKACVFIVATFLGATLYYLIWRACLHLFQVPPAYIQTLFNPIALIENHGYVLQRTLDAARKIYFGDEAAFAHEARSYAVLFFVALTATLTGLARKGIRSIIFGLVFLFGVVSIPFTLNLISGGYVPYRSLVGVPFTVWLFASFLLRICPAGFARNAAFALIFLVLAQNCYSLAILDANTRLVAKHDELLAEQIYQRIVQIRGKAPEGQNQPVEFFGAQVFNSPYPRVYSSTAGYSFFEWDGGNPYRILSFLRLLGHSDLSPIDDKVRIRLLPAFASMPTWPEDGSVKLSNGTVLVKLGKEPGSLHRQALELIADPIFDSATLGFAGLQLQNAQGEPSGASLDVVVMEDPMIYIDLGTSVEGCKALQVNLQMKTNLPGMSQLYYVPAGGQGYTERNSVARSFEAADQLITLIAHSDTGFSSTLRLDPTFGRQKIQIHRVTIGCIERIS